jgi:hypothetical protein
LPFHIEYLRLTAVPATLAVNPSYRTDSPKGASVGTETEENSAFQFHGRDSEHPFRSAAAAAPAAPQAATHTVPDMTTILSRQADYRRLAGASPAQHHESQP